ncbi:MAG: hypothetical protein RIS47_1922 [Bacteroidota bacterium]|jgi:IS5 family transposase
MRLYNDLKLRFTSGNWALYPELALFDIILEKNPQFIKIISNDVLEGINKTHYGRKDSPTVEQILRAAIYKEIKQLTYRDLERDMYDSKICSEFLRLETDQGFSYSVLQKYISKIREESIRSIILEINKIAISEGLEKLEKISTDTTVIETNIHYPTNNSLIYDCIEVATRLLKRIKKDNKDDQDKLDQNKKSAKILNFKINNSKKDDHPTLFDPYLSVLLDLIFESWREIRSNTTKKSVKLVCELKTLLPMMIKSYRNAKSHEIDKVPVKNEDKIFSIHEPHSQIIVKGKREVEFGHKCLVTRGSSTLLLDYKVFEGIPSDKNLLLPSIQSIKENYKRTPISTSNDGGFCSNANIKGCIKEGIVNVVFTKITKSLKNIVDSIEIENELKRWRGTTEAVISNLKRGFGLNRVTWEGFDKFCSKVAWGVLGYNLRVISNRLLEIKCS